MKPKQNLLQRIINELVERKIFRRERKEITLKALGILLYHFGLSLRQVSDFLFLFW
jgi:hypothetical protein